MNIDTTDLNTLNQQFNQGLQILDAEAQRLRDLNDRVLKYKPIEITEISYYDQPADSLRTKNFSAQVAYYVLGEPGTANIQFDLNDPVGSIVNNIGQFLPKELRG